MHTRTSTNDRSPAPLLVLECTGCGAHEALDDDAVDRSIRQGGAACEHCGGSLEVLARIALKRLAA